MAYTQAYQLGFAKVASDLGLDQNAIDCLFDLEKDAGFNEWWAQVKGSLSGKINDARTAYSGLRDAWSKIPGTSVKNKITYLSNGLGTMADIGNKINTVKSDVKGFSDKLSGFWKGLSPDVRRSLLASLAIGAIPLLFSSGSFGNRLAKSVGVGALGGLGTYGFSRTGGYNRAKDYLTSVFGQGKTSTQTTPVAVVDPIKTTNTQADATK